MRFRLLRRKSVDRVGDVVFPLRLRVNQPAWTDGSETWLEIGASNSFEALQRVLAGLSPRDCFRILDTEKRATSGLHSLTVFRDEG